MTKTRSFKDLIVWQKSIELVISIYKLTEKFPDSEKFNLASQIRRAAASIPSNIAGERSRGTARDFTHFLNIAYGSGAEPETLMDISKRLQYVPDSDYNDSCRLLEEVMKMLNVMIFKLQAKR